MTTRDDIARWLGAAPKTATHMIVACDTFDWEDYPVYVETGTDPRQLVKEKYSGQNMQTCMEVYSLSKPLDAQILATRVFNY